MLYIFVHIYTVLYILYPTYLTIHESNNHYIILGCYISTRTKFFLGYFIIMCCFSFVTLRVQFGMETIRLLHINDNILLCTYQC